jgi:integrase
MSNGRPRRPWSARSLNLLLTVLQMVLEDAVKQGWVVRNVAHLVDRVPQTKREMQTFTEADVHKLLKAAESDRLEAAWHLALSGLRRGEVCGLTWDDVDLEVGELNIRHTRILVDGVVIESMPKTAKGERALPLPDSLTRVLKRARMRQAEDRLRLPGDYLDGGYVVADEGGSPMHPETLGLAWGRLLDRAGVRRLRLHDVRHTYATLAQVRGIASDASFDTFGDRDGIRGLGIQSLLSVA